MLPPPFYPFCRLIIAYIIEFPSYFQMAYTMTSEKEAIIPTLGVTGKSLQRAPSTLMGLSQELRREICEHLSKQDLVNASLVNKAMQDAAIRPLYRNIALRLEDHNTKTINRISDMLTRENPGIEHIQHVRIKNWCESPRTSCQHWADVSMATTKYLINGLPRDQLKSFSWDSIHDLKPDLSMLLLKRQRKLEHVELMPLTHSQFTCIKHNFETDENLTKAVQNAKSLLLMPNADCCLDAAGLLVRSAKKTKIFKFNGDELDDSVRRISTNEEGEVTDPVFTKVLSHLKQPGAQPMQLTCLSLYNVDLEHCKTSYATVINFSTLKKLRLLYCWRLELFLECMMSPDHDYAPRLEQFMILNVQDDHEHQLPSILDSFLGYFRGLKDLQLQLVNPGVLPAVRNITRHGETLERLSVNVRKEPRSVTPEFTSYSAPLELTQLCTSLPNLTQLAISIEEWPEAVETSLSPEEGSFEQDVVAPLSKLPKLRLLNVLNWPTLNDEYIFPVAAYGALLDSQATSFFRKFSESQARQHKDKLNTLRVLAFGEHEDNENNISGIKSEDQEPTMPRFVYWRDQGRSEWSESQDTARAVRVKEQNISQLGVDTGLLKNNLKIRSSGGPASDF
ncbi:unnamed protein product [Periconia digitata]|uniref:F-box domain-containing protein n=1 Tax=Periconia digitata TaxID=1303443 RepID=A0A9W4XP65_9PLEO|nr:unnamed protein product [Periconia digitata]